MSVLTALYSLFIGPLELFFEIVFSLSHRVISNPGLCIIFLSLAMNFLVFPLYKRADAMQAEERENEKKLRPWITHIKKTFKGDERFMMLQTYYRQNHYKPTYALKGSVSLLLEIPFFIAAYNFLSTLEVLNGVSFGPIKDLGAPDGMMVIAGVTINFLPILMTLVNLVSSAIYTKGLSVKSKIQLYAMAAIFLVFLYESPSGLVFYWTLNNIFSLFKNIFYKLKNPKLVLCILSSLVSAVLLGMIFTIAPLSTGRKQFFVTAFLVMLQLPLIFYLISRKKKEEKEIEYTKKNKMTFLVGTVFLTVLTGILIPSSVINASPEEFINTLTLTNPLVYILNCFLLAAGTFLVWFGIFYMLANTKGKKVMEFSVCALSLVSVIDYMFFGKGYGTLSAKLEFDSELYITNKDQILNALILTGAVLILYYIWKEKGEFVRFLFLAAAVALAGMSFMNVKNIQDVSSSKIAQLEERSKQKAVIPLHKNGKNVMIIMMDRGINSYVPYMFHEKPELKEKFEGFTYYPNTISFGAFTNFGTPGLYGGYEYTPTEMNRRSDELLVDKHNEALKVMPVMFDQAGFETTVCDPTYAGYDWIPDLSIYDEYPDINKYITMGKFNESSEEMIQFSDQTLKRNFFCYSLFKASPVFCQPTIYNKGFYNELDTTKAEEAQVESPQVCDGYSKASGNSDHFLRSYAVLQNLSNITDVKESEENTFLMISNDATHDPVLLKEPEYEPASVIDNTKYDQEHADRFTLNGYTMKMENEIQMMHYQCNMASMIQLGKWFDYMRKNDVYDNTKIIIVSDHGSLLEQFDHMQFGEEKQENVMLFNALLMVKDFDSKEFTQNNEFMTNADVPTIASSDLIMEPKNPFTGNVISSSPKTESAQRIFYSLEWDTNENNGTEFMEGKWYSVEDDIFNKENWKKLDQ